MVPPVEIATGYRLKKVTVFKRERETVSLYHLSFEYNKTESETIFLIGSQAAVLVM